MKLHDGISSCEHCIRVFDTSPIHQALSASWVVRKWHITDIEQLRWKFNYDDCVIDLVSEYVIDKGFTHDEFLKVVENANLCLDLPA